MRPMTFDVAAEAYDRFIGRYSRELAPRFLEFSGVETGPVLAAREGVRGPRPVVSPPAPRLDA